MAWRASLSICRKSVRAGFYSAGRGCACPLPSGSAPPLVCGPIRPKRMRTRVGMPRKHARRRLQGNINSLHANVRTSATTRGTSSGLDAMPTSTRAKRPTILFTNGYDGTITDMLFASVVAASRRGLHLVGLRGIFREQLDPTELTPT